MTEPKMIQSLARAFTIAEYISQHGNAVGLAQISRGVGLSKGTAHGLIATLVHLGYLQQEQETGKYRLGMKFFEMGRVVHDSMDLRSLSLPSLKQLVKKYEETAHLAVLSGQEVIYIEKVDSPHSIRIISNIGGRNPAYCTGVGKVLLAHLQPSKLSAVLLATEFEALTPNTITDAEALRQHLKEVQKQGYALDLEEIELGLSCIAVPLKNDQGTVVAAISISGPSNRLTNAKLKSLAADVVQTAALISEKLGYKADAL